MFLKTGWREAFGVVVIEIKNSNQFNCMLECLNDWKALGPHAIGGNKTDIVQLRSLSYVTDIQAFLLPRYHVKVWQ